MSGFWPRAATPKVNWRRKQSLQRAQPQHCARKQTSASQPAPGCSRRHKSSRPMRMRACWIGRGNEAPRGSLHFHFAGRFTFPLLLLLQAFVPVSATYEHDGADCWNDCGGQHGLCAYWRAFYKGHRQNEAPKQWPSTHGVVHQTREESWQ